MADITQSSSTTATSAPSYYTDYLSNLASKGTAAGAAATSPAGAAAWDPTANQTAAFTNVAANVGNYLPGLAAAGSSFDKANAIDISGAANPYLKAGTATSGLTAAQPTLASGLAQNTGVATANPYLTAGTTTSGLTAAQPNLTAGSSSSADLVGGYMNPYTQNVVDQIRLANQQNIQQNLSPGITAGAVGGGQFGSQRGSNALALGISNANIGALGAQSAALQSGYTEALRAAQAQRAAQLTAGQSAGTLQTQANANQVNAGQIAGNLQSQQAQNALTAGQTMGTLQNQANVNQVTAGQVAGNMATQQGQLTRDIGTAQAALANQTQTQGLADVNALATLGGQQQTIAQNKVLQPLDVLGKQASIMTGAQLPMSTTSTMNASPLSAIAGLGSLGVGMFTKNPSGSTPWDNVSGAIKTGWNALTGTPTTTDTSSIPGTDTGTNTGPFLPESPTNESPDGFWDVDSEGNSFWQSYS